MIYFCELNFTKAGYEMIALVSQALKIFAGNFALLAGIAVLIGMPKAFLQSLFMIFVIGGEENSFWADMLAGTVLELIFGTLMAGALIAALTGIRSGNDLPFTACLTSGLRNWSRLFAARLIPMLGVSLGFLAFMIPGIVLLIRWLFVDYAVLLEGADSSSARKRSAELIRGARWEALGILLILFAGAAGIGWGVGVPSGFIETIVGRKLFFIDVVTRTITELLEVPVIITFFLFYWQRKEAEMKTQQSCHPEPPPLPASDAVPAQTPE